jgi:hypothetical protein
VQREFIGWRPRVCELPKAVGIPQRPRPRPRGAHLARRSGVVPMAPVAIAQACSSRERRKAGEEIRTYVRGSTCKRQQGCGR